MKILLLLFLSAHSSLTTTTGTIAISTGSNSSSQTEVLAYTFDRAGNKSTAGTKVVNVDRIAPTISGFACEPEDSNKIKMKVTGATDTGGSNLQEYWFFTENNASTIKKVTSSATNYSYSFNTAMGMYLGQSVVVDQAGNVSTIKCDEHARTKMWKVNIDGTVDYQIIEQKVTTSMQGYSPPLSFAFVYTEFPSFNWVSRQWEGAHVRTTLEKVHRMYRILHFSYSTDMIAYYIV